jgi:2-polyprenyl-3-methyl-5-hydroxy-6-metoxy-1,4-benzoquinol methylase
MDTIYKNKGELIEELIRPEDTVLDVGFWGQGVTVRDEHWPHTMLAKRAKEVWGIDLDFDQSLFPQERYFRMSAEDFALPMKFDVIFAGDLIEHLSNPGLFLASCRRHLKEGGRLVLTTPNCYSLFSLTEKLMKPEPTVNRDHTCYFNVKTLHQLLGKNGWRAMEDGYLYTLDVRHVESWKKKMLNIVYRLASLFTPKFLETIVVVATPRHEQ